MRFSPKIDNTRPLMITILFTVISIFSILFAGYFQSAKWIFQLSFLCFATAALQIFMKYVLTKYEYVCDENSMVVYKILGKRRLCVGVVDFKNFNTSANKITRGESAKALCNEYNAEKILDFTRNYKSSDIYGFSYNYDSINVYIKIEADESFINYLNDSISSIPKGEETYDEF